MVLLYDQIDRVAAEQQASSAMSKRAVANVKCCSKYLWLNTRACVHVHVRVHVCAGPDAGACVRACVRLRAHARVCTRAAFSLCVVQPDPKVK